MTFFRKQQQEARASMMPLFRQEPKKKKTQLETLIDVMPTMEMPAWMRYREHRREKAADRSEGQRRLRRVGVEERFRKRRNAATAGIKPKRVGLWRQLNAARSPP